MARLNPRWSGYLPGTIVQIVTQAELDFCAMGKPRTAEVLYELLTPEIKKLLGQHGVVIGIMTGAQTQYIVDIAPEIRIDERLIRMYQPEERR